MSRKTLFVAFAVLLAFSALTGPATAQEDAIASGLNNPRKLAYGSDGALYITEAGSGGDASAEGPYGPVTFGLTSQVTVVSPDGEQTVLIPELVSLDQGFGTIDGADAILITDESYWLVLGLGPKTPPEGKYIEAVVELDRETLEVRQAIDLRSFEDAHNPDGGQEIVSNPIDLAVAGDGTLYIADASGNSLLTWTPDGGLQLFAAWQTVEGEPQAVPTSVDIGPDGDIYVGFLSGFPFPPQGARIERWSPDGVLKQTYAGLNLVTDILVTDEGVIYAVEMASGFGDTGYIPNSGRIVEVGDAGPTPIMTGLNFPYGLARDDQGNLVVTVDSAFVTPDSGRVISVVRGGAGGAAPAATPEVATTPESSG